MLIGKRKERAAAEEQFRRQTEEQLRKLSDQAAAEQDRLCALQEEIKHIRGDLSRQNMALEDCLETLSAFEEEQENSRRQKRTAEAEKQKLLDLLALYQEQMWSMKTFAAEHDTTWLKQLSLWEKALREKMISCGMLPIGEIGETVNYELHEVIKTVETTEHSSDRKVAAVYRPGYQYQGIVGRKAQVAVYRTPAETKEGK